MRTVSIAEALTYQDKMPGVALIEYQPGNGTRYALSLHNFSSWPNKTKARFGFPNEACLVTWLGAQRSMWVSLMPSLLHPSYVQEKLKCSKEDAMILAEIIGTLCGREVISTFEG